MYHTCDPSTRVAESVGPRAQGQCRLHSEFQVFQVMMGNSVRDHVSETTMTKLLDIYKHHFQIKDSIQKLSVHDTMLSKLSRGQETNREDKNVKLTLMINYNQLECLPCTNRSDRFQEWKESGITPRQYIISKKKKKESGGRGEKCIVSSGATWGEAIAQTFAGPIKRHRM